MCRGQNAGGDRIGDARLYFVDHDALRYVYGVIRIDSADEVSEDHDPLSSLAKSQSPHISGFSGAVKVAGVRGGGTFIGTHSAYTCSNWASLIKRVSWQNRRYRPSV